MSANNWTTCPNCKRMRQAKIEAVRSRYGRVTFSQFVTDLEKASAPPEDSLRENCECYLDGFDLHIAYRCSCDVCGWRSSFKQIPIDLAEEEVKP